MGAELLRLNTSKSGDQQVCLSEYIDRLKEGQNDMYHNTGDSIAVVSSSQFLENLRKLMMEVLGDKVEKVECVVQEIVEIFVSRMTEENVEAVKHVLQEQVQKITVEQFVDVPVYGFGRNLMR